MNITQKPLTENHSELNIVMEPSDFREDVEKTLRKYRKEAHIPGFRNGNIPMGVIMKRFGKEVLAGKLNEISINALGKYLEENKIDLVGRPLLKSGFNSDEAFLDTNYSFVFELGLLPKFDPVIPKDNVVFYRVDVNKSMVEKHIEMLRVKYGKVSEPETSGQDDYLRIKFSESDEQGRKVASAMQGATFIKISNISNEEMRSKFLGVKKNDEIFLSLGAGTTDELVKLLGIQPEKMKEVKHGLKISVIKIERFEKAELDDSFYTIIFSQYGVASADGLHQAITDEFTGSFYDQSRALLLDDVLHRLAGQPGFDLPVDYLKNLYGYLTNSDPAVLDANPGFSDFCKGMKLEIVKKSLIRHFDIKVLEDDLFEYAGALMEKEYPYLFNNISAREGKDPQMNKKEFYKNLARISFQKKEAEEEKEKMINRLFDKKVAAKLVDVIAPEQKSVTYEEFSKLIHKH